MPADVGTSEATALSAPDAAKQRADFTIAEMTPARDLFFAQSDNRSSGTVIYRMRLLEVRSKRLVIQTENVTAVRFWMLPLFAPGDVQALYFLAGCRRTCGAITRWPDREARTCASQMWLDAGPRPAHVHGMAGRGKLVTGGRIGVEPRVAHGPSNRRFGRTKMAIREHIRHPVEWGADQLKSANLAVERASHSLRAPEALGDAAVPAVRRIEPADLMDVLASGLRDFGAYRTDVIFLCIIYPLAGLLLASVAFGYDMLPMLFPLASGFALIGPVAAVGLYEMSRRHEQGVDITWADAFGVVRAPAFGAILVLGLVLLAIFLLWLAAAYLIWLETLGPQPPASLGAFAHDVFMTGAGWTMIVVGIGVGFLFALTVLAISVVSFPLLLDRDVGLYMAIATSVRAVWTNPGPMAIWGLIVAAGLVLGSIPVLLGLIIVMPVLGHATWHLYRKVVPR